MPTVNLKLLACAAAACLAAYGAGFAHRAHLCGLANAERTGAQTTVQSTTTGAVRAADTSTTKRLESQLAQAQGREQALQALIDEARHASQTPTAVDCRLPDRLRDALDASLAGRP